MPMPLITRRETRHWMRPKSAVAFISVLSTLVLLSGCIRPYKIDVQQGNVLTAEQVQQVKPGMSRREVRFVLGSPPVADSFHQNRWDYVYTHRPSKRAKVERRQFAIMFENDVVSSVDGDLSQLEGVEQRYVLDGHLVDPSKTKKKSRLSRLFKSDEEKQKKKAEREARKKARQLDKEIKKLEDERKRAAQAKATKDKATE